MTQPHFTNPEHAIEECVFLTQQTGTPHSIVQCDDHLVVVPRSTLDWEAEILETVRES